MANILITDDDNQVLSLLISYLKREGHDIITAQNGKQAIRILSESTFDLVITDIIMPEQDGFEVLMWLKNNPSNTKIITISGGSPSLDMQYLLSISHKLGACKVLQKPFDYVTVVSAVAEVLA